MHIRYKFRRGCHSLPEIDTKRSPSNSTTSKFCNHSQIFKWQEDERAHCNYKSWILHRKFAEFRKQRNLCIWIDMTRFSQLCPLVLWDEAAQKSMTSDEKLMLFTFRCFKEDYVLSCCQVAVVWEYHLKLNKNKNDKISQIEVHGFVKERKS